MIVSGIFWQLSDYTALNFVVQDILNGGGIRSPLLLLQGPLEMV